MEVSEQYPSPVKRKNMNTKHLSHNKTDCVCSKNVQSVKELNQEKVVHKKEKESERESETVINASIFKRCI